MGKEKQNPYHWVAQKLMVNTKYDLHVTRLAQVSLVYERAIIIFPSFRYALSYSLQLCPLPRIIKEELKKTLSGVVNY